ncbi:MAG TPA: hypothetical protein G4O20_06760 [Dehalococcoidia bacterium]|nr:hypothetical protein [Dehalococcoidia bacterium]
MVVDRIIIPIAIIIVGGILAWYLIVPLMLYILDTIAFLIAKILTKLFPRNVNMPNNPNQSTIQSGSRTYNPNPIQYLLHNYPHIPKGFANNAKNSSKNPFPEDNFDMPYDPVVKNANGCSLKPHHNKSIISRKQPNANKTIFKAKGYMITRGAEHDHDGL